MPKSLPIEHPTIFYIDDPYSISNSVNSIVIKYVDFNLWELKQELIVLNPFDPKQVILVPVNFQTDLASIPRIFWALFPPFGKYIRASIIHDYLISISVSNSNRVAHDIFYQLMIHDGVNPFIAWIFYQVVRFKDFFS
jgi:hypothetical protein